MFQNEGGGQKLSKWFPFRISIKIIYFLASHFKKKLSEQHIMDTFNSIKIWSLH